MKKVISFCLWGNKTKYTIGSIRNTDLAKEFYPDFECWIYIHEPTVPKEIVDQLKIKDNVKIFLRNGDLNTCKPMMWRFEPIDDEDVEIMMSRDTDTRILSREKLAVEEWLNSDKIFHIMRDHPYHSNLILGGMFGVKKNILIINNWKNLMNQFNQNNYDYDQQFLAEFIYPKIKDNVIIHASFHKFEGSECKNFPTDFDDSYDFVGQYVYEDESRNNEHRNIIKHQLMQK